MVVQDGVVHGFAKGDTDLASKSATDQRTKSCACDGANDGADRAGDGACNHSDLCAAQGACSTTGHAREGADGGEVLLCVVTGGGAGGVALGAWGARGTLGFVGGVGVVEGHALGWSVSVGLGCGGRQGRLRLGGTYRSRPSTMRAPARKARAKAARLSRGELLNMGGTPFYVHSCHM